MATPDKPVESTSNTNHLPYVDRRKYINHCCPNSGYRVGTQAIPMVIEKHKCHSSNMTHTQPITIQFILSLQPDISPITIHDTLLPYSQARDIISNQPNPTEPIHITWTRTPKSFLPTTTRPKRSWHTSQKKAMYHTHHRQPCTHVTLTGLDLNNFYAVTDPFIPRVSQLGRVSLDVAYHWTLLV